MGVVLTDGAYVLRRRTHPEGDDAHGTPVPGPANLAVFIGEYPGATADQGQGRWTFRLDPAAWPVTEDDLLTGPDGVQYVVTGQPRLFTNPAADDVDYVGGECTLVTPRRI